MLPVLLAAALSSAARPLFVPPPGFDQLTRDPIVESHVASHGGTFIAEYRRTAHEPYANGRVLLSRSIVVTITTGNGFGLSPRDDATTQLAELQRRAKLKDVRSHAISLCGGRTGWMISYLPQPSDQREVQVFAQGGSSVYLATLTYPTAVGDFGATRAMSTLCPPQPAAVSQSVESLPFTLPEGWSRSTAALSVSPPMSAIGRWMHLAAHSSFLESLLLVKAPPLQDGVSPEEQTEAMLGYMQSNAPGFALKSSHSQTYCGADGWFASSTERQGQSAYAVDTAYAYGATQSYFLTYYYRVGDAPNPAALRALNSLCSPAGPSPTPVPTPSPEPSPTRRAPAER